MKRFLPYLLIVTALLCGQMQAAEPRQPRFDLVVYGATPSGIVASIAAAREGLHVALVEPGQHIGGMVSSGLSFTDTGNTATIGGIAREFFSKVGQHYGKDVEWGFEPHVAQQVFEDMLQKEHVSVFFGSRLRRPGGVVKRGARIISLKTEDGATFSATVFIDSSYEGDLMAESGVSFTRGREPAAQYDESYAGVIPTLRSELQFRIPTSPYAADGSLLPGVSALPKGQLGQGDLKIPAYNFRLCFTKDKSDQIAFFKPDPYDPHQYELLARYLPALEKHLGRPLHVGDVLLLQPLQKGKWDVNNNGPFSTDLIGENWTYPTASYAERQVFYQRQLTYEQGFLYFLAHDARVPANLQAEINRYGLAKDEFVGNNGWPWQLFVREARRMVGEYVIRQDDALKNVTKDDSIGMGSYGLDSHNVQRVVALDGAVENEGDMWIATIPYEIPFRSILPKRSEVTNLVVPVCASTSHTAYGTVRQEPVYMILGQAAGEAAAMATHEKRDLQDLSIAKLQAKLVAAHAVLHWSQKITKSSPNQAF
jgi:hypothetical protein